MKLNRGLQRGIAVIRALMNGQAQSLNDLNAATKLPKPTLLRLLRTLEIEGIVWRSLSDGSYRYRQTALLGHRRHEKIAELASPYLADLQKKVLWPSDLVVRRGYFMELIETSRGLSRLSLAQDRLGKHIDMIGSAVGRAYLAFCPGRDCDRIVNHIAAHPELRGTLGPVDRPELKRALEDARRRGYATRSPSLTNARRRNDDDDRLDAIAVPIMAGNRVAGCLNVVWLRHLRIKDKLIRTHLKDLQAAADVIGASVHAAAGRSRG